MKSSAILYIATSLDGYIAEKNGGVGWLDRFDPPQGSDYGYTEFYAQVGTLIMGRRTYDQVVGFDVDWPYPDRDTIILTSDPTLELSTPRTSVISENIRSELESLKKTSQNNIWVVGGAKLVVSLMQFQYIDQIQLFRMPVILGEGVSLFPEGTPPASLELLNIEKFDNGVTSSTFAIEKK
jgi:dihydrofolate reductase